MASSASSISGIAKRYASSLFELALEEGKLPAVEKDLAGVMTLLEGNEELKKMIHTPVITEDEQFSVMEKILDKAKVKGLVGNFVRVLTRNGRLPIFSVVAEEFSVMVSRHNGEEVAEVTVATKLTAAQQKELQAALKSVVGKDVSIDAKVDPSIMGGMIVKVGSRQIDTSLKTKLSSLKLALNEVG